MRLKVADMRHGPVVVEFDEKTYVRTVAKEMLIEVLLSTGVVLNYKLKSGFKTDFASVPNWAKRYIDNDDPMIVIPSIVHDINYYTHFLGFLDSNKLFGQMMVLEGMRERKASVIEWAVGLGVARRRYKSYKGEAEGRGLFLGEHVECWFG